ncbi:MAG: hypothetical protein RLZZ112_962 [Verrucomicrobiota bacterium]
MRFIAPLLLILMSPMALRAESCPKACGEVCGTENSCCPAKGKRCGSVQLERGGDPASAYSSKGGLRLR